MRDLVPDPAADHPVLVGARVSTCETEDGYGWVRRDADGVDLERGGSFRDPAEAVRDALVEISMSVRTWAGFSSEEWEAVDGQSRAAWAERRYRDEVASPRP